jgi:adenylate kinase
MRISPRFLIFIYCLTISLSHGLCYGQEVIIFLGPPGSGKSTQAEKLSKEKNLPLVSTGTLVRDEIRKNSAIGITCAEKMEKGEFVSDEIILKLFYKRISERDCEKGYISDGFPRLISLMEDYHKIISKEPDSVVYFSLPRESCIERCSSRLDGRTDDTSTALEKRLDNFEKSTLPVIESYEQKGKLLVIDARQTMETISEILLNVLDKRVLHDKES